MPGPSYLPDAPRSGDKPQLKCPASHCRVADLLPKYLVKRGVWTDPRESGRRVRRSVEVSTFFSFLSRSAFALSGIRFVTLATAIATKGRAAVILLGSQHGLLVRSGLSGLATTVELHFGGRGSSGNRGSTDRFARPAGLATTALFSCRSSSWIKPLSSPLAVAVMAPPLFRQWMHNRSKRHPVTICHLDLGFTRGGKGLRLAVHLEWMPACLIPPARCELINPKLLQSSEPSPPARPPASPTSWPP